MLLPCCVEEMGCLMFVLLPSLRFFVQFGQEQLYNTQRNAIKKQPIRQGTIVHVCNLRIQKTETEARR